MHRLQMRKGTSCISYDCMCETRAIFTCAPGSFLNQALGMKPKRRKPVEMKARLDANEMKGLLQRGGPEDEQEGDAPKPVVEEDEDAIRGLGFASSVPSLPCPLSFLPLRPSASVRSSTSALPSSPHLPTRAPCSAAMRAAPSALGDSSERMEGTGVAPGGGLPPPPPPPPGDYREQAGRGHPGLPRSSEAPGSETLRSLEKLKRKVRGDRIPCCT